MLQYQDMANYLQQPQATMAAAPPFNPIGTQSLFGNTQYVNDYDMNNIKPTAMIRWDYTVLIIFTFSIRLCIERKKNTTLPSDRLRFRYILLEFFFLHETSTRDICVPIVFFLCSVKFTYFPVKITGMW